MMMMMMVVMQQEKKWKLQSLEVLLETKVEHTNRIKRKLRVREREKKNALPSHKLKK